jgi:hypothetical protein
LINGRGYHLVFHQNVARKNFHTKTLTTRGFLFSE